MILFLTHNDQPSGVYWSQVTDVVAHLNGLGGPRVRLLALVSARDYRAIRRKIRSHSPDAIVLPMVPGVKRWRRNTWIVEAVCRLLKPAAIMARGAMATWLALQARDKHLVGKVCFDARGAYAAEWEEYRLVDDDALIGQIAGVEKQAVVHSDFRLAVSEALVEHWRHRYGYAGNEHVVVPCTLGHMPAPDAPGAADMRAELGFATEDVVLVYSGSAAGWQSFALLERFLTTVLVAQPRVKLLFLCPPDPAMDALVANCIGRAVRTWVAPAEVPAMLAAADHALLIRDDTVTNRVASPTKFAEYLASGLPVLVSAHIGDFSALVRSERLGAVLDEREAPPVLAPTSTEERERMRAFALAHFAKAAHDAGYRRLLQALG